MMTTYKIGRYVPAMTFPGRSVSLPACVQYVYRNERGLITQTRTFRPFV
jgi:hypothetical protein